MDSIKTEECIAIDFGTSNTAVYVYKNGKYLNPCYTAENDYCIPSVAVIDKFSINIPDKVDKSQGNHGFVYNVKRILGKVESQFEDSEIDEGLFYSPVKFDEQHNPYFKVSYKAGKEKETRKVYPIEVVTEILKKCKEEADLLLETSPEFRDCVMTIPNYFFDTSKKALKEAAERAGLNVLYFLKEPTAAGIRFISNSNEIKEGEMVMVFDFGGGTLDLTLMVRKGNDFEVKGQGGDPNLGGTKIDEIFCEYVLQEYKDQYGEELLGEVGSKKYKRNYPKLLESCRQMKEQLSTENNAYIIISDFKKGNEKEAIEDMKISVEEFNAKVLKDGNIIKRIETAIKSLLSENHYDKEHISYVILIGGSSKIPHIQDYLKTFFKSIPVSDTSKYNPHTTVVEGAMRVKVNNWYHEVSESLESCLGFKVSDGHNNSELRIDLHPGLQIPFSTEDYFNLSGSDIDVYRSFNGKERIEGTIKVKPALEKFGRQKIRVKITCNKDTSIIYSVYSDDGREIGRLELSPKI